MSKYIDADELMGYLQEIKQQAEADNKTKFDALESTIDVINSTIMMKTDEIMRIVENMPAADVEPVGHWISVDERLPEEPYSCLVVVEGTDRYTGEDYLTVFPVLVGYDGETWNDYDGQEIPVEVKAWLKLPELPKMDGGSVNDKHPRH